MWNAITAVRDALVGAGALGDRRADQARSWFWSELTDTLVERFRADPAVRERLPALEAAVMSGSVTPSAAAQQLLDALG